ncbi:MAG: acetyl-CoA C-acyltransferase, partial [Mycetocola sp.]
MTEAFLVGGVRTPVGRYGGALSSMRPDDLAALTVRTVVERAGLDPALVDEVILGNANGAGEENRNVARMAWLLAGFPDSVPGITVNRLCASGMSAIIMASHMIKAGAADIVIAGGVESMSRAPWVIEKPAKAFAGPGASFDTSIGWRFTNPAFLSGELSRDGKMTYSMPETAEEVARVYGISREDSDAFAVQSHERAIAAIAAGHFTDEIVPVSVPQRKGDPVVFDTDEGPRAGTTQDVLAGLRPVVKGGSVVTAGNASTLNDGASAVIVASERAIERYGLLPRARILDGASAGVSPETMGIWPVAASRKVLERQGLRVDDLIAVELNEAFASQSLACMS